jgi:hypothetical protein
MVGLAFEILCISEVIAMEYKLSPKQLGDVRIQSIVVPMNILQTLIHIPKS